MRNSSEYEMVDNVQKQRTIEWCSYSHASSVSIVIAGLEYRGLIPEGTELYIFAMTSRPAPRPTQLPNRWVQAVLSAQIKRSERKADHSPVSSDPVCCLLRVHISSFTGFRERNT
jgi:hypothetical protein